MTKNPRFWCSLRSSQGESISAKGKRGKSEWDEAMISTGYRASSKKGKKWESRLRGASKNNNVLDSITREQVCALLLGMRRRF